MIFNMDNNIPNTQEGNLVSPQKDIQKIEKLNAIIAKLEEEAYLKALGDKDQFED